MMRGSYLRSSIKRSNCKRLGATAIILPFAIGAMDVTHAESEGLVLEEIIVTAKKREQSIQDVPLSIKALTESAIERGGIDTFRDYATTVPGINFDDSEGPTGRFGRRTVGIRGITRQAGLSLSSVGFYLDETPVDINDPRIFDVNRIEVLRGPQGTLYGSGSVGGTIRIISNQPDVEALDAKVELEYSDLDEGGDGNKFNGMVNIPIVEGKAALRLVGMYREESGFVDAVQINDPSILSVDGDPDRLPISYGSDFSPATSVSGDDINSIEVSGFRASLLWNVTDKLTIIPSFYHQKLEVDGEPEILLGLGGFQTLQFSDTSSEDEFALSSLTIDYELEHGSIVSSTSYYDQENRSTIDATIGFSDTLGTVFCVFDPACSAFAEDLLIQADQFAIQEQTSLTHETRFVSDFKGPLQLIAGVFYEDQQRPFLNDFTSQPTTAGATIFALGGTGFGAGLDSLLIPALTSDGSVIGGVVKAERDLEQVAVFGEFTYSFSDRWDFTAGLRYFRFESDTLDDFTGFLFNAGGAGNKGSASEDGVNPTFALTYQNEDVLVYGRAAKGLCASDSPA